MNRNHVEPDDFQSIAEDVVDASQLSEIEQRLKQARPRCPELDVDAILRSASEADHSVALAQPLKRPKTHTVYRWTGVVVGAWACGVIVGSLVTFVFFGQNAAPVLPSDTMVTVNENPSKIEERVEEKASLGVVERTEQEVFAEDTPSWSQSESLVSAILRDMYDLAPASHGRGSPTLRPRNFAGHKLESGFWQDRLAAGSTHQNPAEIRDTGSDTQDDAIQHVAPPRAAPAAAVTRERLMQELLDANPGSIL